MIDIVLIVLAVSICVLVIAVVAVLVSAAIHDIREEWRNTP